MLAPRQVASLSIHGGNEYPERAECAGRPEDTDDLGTSAGLPSLDIAFYEGPTPHKMGGISAECTVLTGGMLEVNLLLLDG